MVNEFEGSRIFLNIPVFAEKNKKLMQKPKSLLLLGEIVSMLNTTGKFYMSNKKIAKRLQCTIQAVNNYLRLLEDEKFIVRRKVYSKDNKAIIGRIIEPGPTLLNARLLGSPTGVGEGSKQALVRVANGRWYKENSLKEQGRRTVKRTNGQTQPDKSAAVRKKIIVYLNSKLHTSYKPNAAKNKKLINARLNEGYSFDDFKKVIDTKFDDWSKDSRMAKYLRPETLFGTKMEGYVNEKQPTNPNDYHSAGYYEGWNHVGNNQPQSSQPSADSVETDDLPF